MEGMIEYTVIVHEAEEGGYWTEVSGLPGAGSQGETVNEAVENTKESIALSRSTRSSACCARPLRSLWRMALVPSSSPTEGLC